MNPPFVPSAASTRRAAAAEAGLERDWNMLCREIGERRAGSAAERRAVDYIAAQWRAAGLKDVRMESFPCLSPRSSSAEVRALTGRGWKKVSASAVVGAPGTPGKRTLEGEIVWLDMPESAGRLRPRGLRGRILALFGPLPTQAAVHRRLVAAEPAAVVHVDERLPFPWLKSDGVYPYWARRYGMPPTLTVPYTDAWRWRRDGVRRLRVRVAVDQGAALSHNVIAELPGTEPDLPSLTLTAHHDTQCGNPGADDNASGVVCLLALARRFASLSPRRTLRFVSFGTEEQLSVGADAYVRRHAPQAADTALVINFDSVASPLGHLNVWVAGPEALARRAVRACAARGVDLVVQRDICPFFDHFAFNRAGIPSLGFMKSNFPGGRWQHHSPHDTLENVSPSEVRRLLGGVSPLIAGLAGQKVWPFRPGLPREQLRAARTLGRALFGPSLRAR